MFYKNKMQYGAQVIKVTEILPKDDRIFFILDKREAELYERDGGWMNKDEFENKYKLLPDNLPNCTNCGFPIEVQSDMDKAFLKGWCSGDKSSQNETPDCPHCGSAIKNNGG